ncbi:MAG: arylesterase [Gammaproteobacteria bacterium]|nr:arylesterase [Gammaproteobacteria bacterium]
MTHGSRKSGFIKSAAIVVAALALQSCSDPKLSFVPEGGTILAFGDSLTLGVGTDKRNSYPSVLSALSGRQVVNAGVSGETTDRGLERLPEQLSQTNPDLLILLEGGNDILRNKDFAATKRNLAAMIELAQNRGVQVVLLGVPEKRLFLGVAPFYADLAEDYQLVFEDQLVATLLRNSDYKSDPIHLNAKGYRVLAEKIHALLQDNGAF